MAWRRNPAGSWRGSWRARLGQFWRASKALLRRLDAALHAVLTRIVTWYWLVDHVTWWFFHRI